MTTPTKLNLIDAWQVESQGYTLRCHWYPALTMKAAELKQLEDTIIGINAAWSPLSYGFFAKDATAKSRTQFLSKSIWCLVYQNHKPIGFAYQVDLGQVAAYKVFHLGLVKLVANPGKDLIRLPYLALELGNLLNFGPHYATNISHLPVIIDMFGELAHDVFPAFAEQDGSLRSRYREVMDLLKTDYIAPVLGMDASRVCERTFRIRESLVSGDPGFETAWQRVPKSANTLCNLFVKEWLGMHEIDGELRVKDDLIQIGMVDYRFLASARAQGILNASQFLRPYAPTLHLTEALKIGA